MAPSSLKILCLSHNSEELYRFVRKDPRLIDARDEKGRTLLHWAVVAESDEILEFLIEQGADLLAVDAALDTPLMCAIQRGMNRIANLLVSSLSTANKLEQCLALKNIDGQTPLDLLDSHASSHLKVQITLARSAPIIENK